MCKYDTMKKELKYENYSLWRGIKIIIKKVQIKKFIVTMMWTKEILILTFTVYEIKKVYKCSRREYKFSYYIQYSSDWLKKENSPVNVTI